MKSMQTVRGQVSTIVDIDFFLNEENLNGSYEDERIARIIKGAVYERTKQRINEFIARCDQTLGSLQDRINQAESEHSSLVRKARSEEPGSAPSTLWVNQKDPNAVAKHNREVDRHNAQAELHRRIVDQANHAKERYENAVDRYTEKKADLEEQIREKLEDLKPALDQDILTFLGKMQQLAYDNIRNKERHFEGFLLSYLVKKAYIFLYDKIDNTSQQRAATDIFRRLDDELDTIMTSNTTAVKDGLFQAAQFLNDCYIANSELLKNIQEKLKLLPYKLCDETREEVRNLVNLPVSTAFEYKHIIDPKELAKVEAQVTAQKRTFEKNVQVIDAFASRFDPTFAEISSVKDFAEAEFAKMQNNKAAKLDPVSKDIFFTFGIFEEDDQEQYLKKYKPWIQNVQGEIEKSLKINLRGLVTTITETALLTKSTKATLDSDQALVFFSNKQKLKAKRQELVNGINTLDSILGSINRLPQEKSEAFTKKMSTLMYLSLLPLGNVGVLYSVLNMVKTYRPAFSSNNAFYVALKENHIKKFQNYFYIHLGLTLASGVAALLIALSVIALPIIVLPLIIGFTYFLPTVAFYSKGNQLKKM